MSKKPRNHRIRVGGGVPRGYFLGRTSHGHGRVELIDAQAAAAANGPLASVNQQIQNQKARHGIGFQAAGLLTINELLGQASCPSNMSFVNSDPLTNVTAQVPPTSTAVMNLNVNNVLAATITFSPGVQAGVVNWLSSPYNIAAGAIIMIYGPSPADTTLAYVVGTINGSLV